MQQLIRDFESAQLKAAEDVPVIKPGDTVRVKINLYEGRILPVIAMKKIQRIAAKGKSGREQKAERQQTFEGTVIGVQGSGLRQKFTVRKLASGVGVEKTFFVHTTRVAAIEVVRRSHVRRAKLYYLRDRVGKATRLREKRENVAKVD
ncbi:50S ribosomal protein L19 [bacterium]|nr:50S ribosomal protein L19 [bacterium]